MLGDGLNKGELAVRLCCRWQAEILLFICLIANALDGSASKPSQKGYTVPEPGNIRLENKDGQPLYLTRSMYDRVKESFQQLPIIELDENYPEDLSRTEGDVLNYWVPGYAPVTSSIGVEINGNKYTHRNLPENYILHRETLEGKSLLTVFDAGEHENNMNVTFFWSNSTDSSGNTANQIERTRTAQTVIYAPDIVPPSSANTCHKGLKTGHLDKSQVHELSLFPGQVLPFNQTLGAELYDYGLYLNASTGFSPLNRYLEEHPKGQILVVCDDSAGGAIPLNEPLLINRGAKVSIVGWRQHCNEFTGSSGAGLTPLNEVADTGHLCGPGQKPVKINVNPALMSAHSAIRCIGRSRCILNGLSFRTPEGSCISPSGNSVFIDASSSSGRVMNCRFQLPEGVLVARGDGQSIIYRENSIVSSGPEFMSNVRGTCRTFASCNGQPACLENDPLCALQTSNFPRWGVNLGCKPIPPQLTNTVTPGGSSVPVNSSLKQVTPARVAAATATAAVSTSCIGPYVTPTAGVAGGVPAAVLNGTVAACLGGCAAFVLLEEAARYKYGLGKTLFDLAGWGFGGLKSLMSKRHPEFMVEKLELQQQQKVQQVRKRKDRAEGHLYEGFTIKVMPPSGSK